MYHGRISIIMLLPLFVGPNVRLLSQISSTCTSTRLIVSVTSIAISISYRHHFLYLYLTSLSHHTRLDRAANAQLSYRPHQSFQSRPVVLACLLITPNTLPVATNLLPAATRRNNAWICAQTQDFVISCL